MDRIEQIRAWEAGELYPDHDTFSFGHGFGTALVEEFDTRDAIITRFLNGWMVTAQGEWEIPGYQGPHPMTPGEAAYFESRSTSAIVPDHPEQSPSDRPSGSADTGESRP